ncbi:MAG: cupin domain-containing protein [Nitrospirota bacterium]|jgi:quercetin dioxygenase-like cupin family protein
MGIIHRFVGKEYDFNWEGAIPRDYLKPGTKDSTGKVIIGKADGAKNFIFRYFRVEPGGWTSLESHSHDHGIFILHGRAQILLGEEKLEVGPRDVIFIPPNEVHQLIPIGDESLGFLCVIPPKEKELG